MTSAQIHPGSGTKAIDWERRLDVIVDTMREMSRQTDPQELVRSYGSRIRAIFPADRYIALSRRDLPFPKFRITRFSGWEEEINPWTQKDRLPVLEGGLLGELLYGDRPRVIDEVELDPADPGAPFIGEMRSLIAIPHYDGGTAPNMAVLLRATPFAFDREEFPEHVWMSNLFGRATHGLRLADELKRAYAIVERELRVVADIQRSLLPKTIPDIPGLNLAAHYQTSQWAGGDYYDFFPLIDGRWGIMIADVSGHGTPAAVMMAITHSIAHSFPGPPHSPSAMLEYLNNVLATRYTADSSTFVTAFYGIYDPARHAISYASAGHNPPRLKRCEDGTIHSLDGVANLPLGVFPDQKYEEMTQTLRPGDQIIFYTDGITEATDPSGRMFGLARLDQALENCHLDASGLIHSVLERIEDFTAGAPAADDRTMLVAKVS